MADGLIQVPTDGTGKKVDAEELVVGANTVERQRVQLSGAAAAALAAVLNAAPTTEYGIVTRNIPSGTQLERASDGTNSETTLFDLDSGAGTQYARGVSLRKAASGGSVELGTSADPIRNDPTGTTVQPVSGTVSANLNAGSNNIGDVDVLTLPALVAGTANIGDVDVASMPTGASAAQAQGDVANDGVDSGNPVKVGGLASGSVPSAVAAADRVNAYHDREGRQIVRPWGAGDWAQVNFPAANTRASSTKAAGAAGVRHVCTGFTAALAAGTTAPAAAQLDVRVRDGILDTGTILWQMVITLPATAGAMNGVALSGLNIRGTAATAMTIEFSAAGGANTFESVAIQGVDITEA